VYKHAQLLKRVNEEETCEKVVFPQLSFHSLNDLLTFAKNLGFP